MVNEYLEKFCLSMNVLMTICWAAWLCKPKQAIITKGIISLSFSLLLSGSWAEVGSNVNLQIFKTWFIRGSRSIHQVIHLWWPYTALFILHNESSRTHLVISMLQQQSMSHNANMLLKMQVFSSALMEFSVWFCHVLTTWEGKGGEKQEILQKERQSDVDSLTW